MCDSDCGVTAAIGDAFAGDYFSRLPAIPPQWPYDAEFLQKLEGGLFRIPVKGPGEADPGKICLVRFLRDGDLDAVEALNELVLSRLPRPDILRREDRGYLALHLVERGRLIGAFLDGRMIAFTLLSFPRDDPDNLGMELGLARSSFLRCCHFELSGVHPDFRGFHLHAIMNEIRSEFAAAAGYHHLFGTVSPYNPYSLNNHLAAGMLVRKLVRRYGGMHRYVIYRDFTRPHALSPDALRTQRFVACKDLAAQQELLAAGLWGVSLRKDVEAGWQLGYLPSTEFRFQGTGVTGGVERFLGR